MPHRFESCRFRKLYNLYIEKPVYLYAIWCLFSDHSYIGVSSNDLHRLKDHFRGRHSNIRLQNAMKKYGTHNFVMMKLGEFSNLTWALDAEAETEILWRANKIELYNIATCGKSSMLGRKHRFESLQIMRQKTKAWANLPESIEKARKLFTEHNPMLGKKGEDCPNSKLTQMQADEIRDRLSMGEKVVDLVKEFKVCKSTISRIKTKKVYA